MRMNTTRSTALLTKNGKKEKMGSINQLSIIPHENTVTIQMFVKAVMEPGKSDKATKKVAMAKTKGTMTAKDGSVFKETSGANNKAIATVILCTTKNAYPTKMMKKRINLTTTVPKGKVKEVNPKKNNAIASQNGIMTKV